MNTEDDEFTRIERESKQRLEAVKSNINSQKQFLRIEDEEIQAEEDSIVAFILKSHAPSEDVIRMAFEYGVSWAEYELEEKNK